MADVQITCIRKPDRENTHESITHVGNSQGVWAKGNVINWIDSKEHTFYTLAGGVRANIGVYRETGKAPYLRTHADGKWNNNLLALPECPRT